MENKFITIFTFLLLGLLCSVQCATILNLPEGAPCNVDTNRNGTCTALYKCHTAATSYLYIDAGLAKKVPQLPPTCSYKKNGEPIVCCTDCEIDEKESLKNYAVFANGNLHEKNGSKAWESCLEFYRTLPYPCRGQGDTSVNQTWNAEKRCDETQYSRYVSNAYGAGVPAERNQFPHMAILGFGELEVAQWLCGGTVISERFILTAAHCASTPSLGDITYAGLGILTRSELHDFWRIYKIIFIVKHPQYKSPSKYHDIALVKTEHEINFNNNLLPACLDVGGIYTTQSGAAPGWGRLSAKGRLAEQLQVMYLSKYSDEECSAIFQPHRLFRKGYDNVTQMCFGRKDKVIDTCEGDSGGPMQSYYYDCIFFVYGVTSFGKDCAMIGNAGIYTRVSHYVPWIESIVWPDQ